MILVPRQAKQCPQWATDRLIAAGGRNPYGEPNWRMVWGWTRRSWVCGKWEDRDEEGMLIREVVENRLVPIHVPLNAWHLEKWLPRECWAPTPEAWQQMNALDPEEEGLETVNMSGAGPYPRRGDYMHVTALTDEKDRYIPLTLAAMEFLVRILRKSQIEAKTRSRESLDALRRRELAKDDDYNQFADSVLDDTFPAFGTNTPFSVVPRNYAG